MNSLIYNAFTTHINVHPHVSDQIIQLQTKDVWQMGKKKGAKMGGAIYPLSNNWQSSATKS